MLGATRRYQCLVGFFCLVAAMAASTSLRAEESVNHAPTKICVTDDAQRKVCIATPARRIIALSPGATELLYAAGAGDYMVGAVAFSDFPDAAKQLPRVGSYKRLDMEAVLALKPDLIVAWRSGNPVPQTERLEALGFPIYFSEPLRFEGVSTTLERLSHLAGTDAFGQKAANSFRNEIAALRQKYINAAPVGVFYEVWQEPLMTVNDTHLISQAINVCGGVNVFGDLPALAPHISQEAVIAVDPEAIIVSGMGEANAKWLEPWKAFSALQAVRSDNLFFVPPSSIQRPSPSIANGVRILCQHLDVARERR